MSVGVSWNSSHQMSTPARSNFSPTPLPLEMLQNATSRDSDTYYYYGLPIVITLSSLLMVIMAVALVGNVLVIITILRNKDMRTRTNILLCNLALADILTATLDIPVAIYTLSQGRWPFSKAFCVFNGYLVGLGLMLSIHTLMWISIHKFISITRPLARSMTPGKIFCMILAAWAWALLYNLGPVLGWTKTVYKPGASQCGPAIPVGLLMISHSVTNTIFNFLIPICVMSYCYYKIFDEVREHMNRLQDFSDARVISTIIQQRRITKTLVIVFVCFILCWCPYIVYSTLLVKLGEENVSHIFNPLAYLATYLNSACNPVIYALRSPSFRKGFEEILFGSKRVPESPFGDGSFRWTRKNGLVMSFRRSVLRSKSTPDVASRKQNNAPRTRFPKYSISPTDPLLKPPQHRRTNTFPKVKKEERLPSPVVASETLLSPLSPQDGRSLQRLTSHTSATSQMMPEGSSETLSDAELSPFILRDNKDSFLKIENVFSESPSPRNKKYFIYFPKFQNNSLSVSAPNILLSADDEDSSETNTNKNVSNDDLCLKVPDITYTRACSEGDVKPLLPSTTSSHPSIYSKGVPKLVWQASIENLNLRIPSRQEARKEGCPNSPQTDASFHMLDTPRTRKESLLSSVECLINKFFAPGTTRCLSNPPDDQESQSIFYTEEDKEPLSSNQLSVIVTNL